MKRKTLIAISIAGALALLSGVAILLSSPGETTWKELHSTVELREQFNRDTGSTRIVLLLSPT
ncbi:MAG: hypothetical protein ACRD21_08830 [Vicinamibacteria bacterium]